ncbi:PHD finger protein 12-like [Saccostrea echinata]|uniref:PHD finger protein 12-like n=1 Tax=Saccostrea echinata TaxID=191078 RepID=UPI002A7EB4C7|nr:PHD finger protein 12-like [Saccostrea echinata]
MATVEYDLDTSGGLMEQIQKLVAPPVSDEVLRRQRRKERESRRQGRAVNHDSCDSCKEGGDLLCCDWCPAAFHLQCHDPPLEEDDVPPGEWRCHRCKVSPPKAEPSKDKEKDDDASSTKSNSSNTSRKSRPQPPIPIIEEILVDTPTTEHLTPLQKLARAAQLMNPVQFDLPRDIACTTPLPGSSKRKWWGRDRNPNKKFAHELDNGLVPLPAKLCFYCSKSCRVGALVQCDYCPLLYHLDCLNPPLASPPTNRWMCPNHPENVIDEHLLKSVGLTERIKLWNKFNNRISQHTVKLNFLNKIHRESPPFRIKVKHPRRKSLAIPEAIKLHYQNPSPLLPCVTDPDTTAVVETDEKTVPDTTLEDQEEWLSAVVSLQTSIARHLAQKQIQKSSSESGKSEQSVKTEKPTASVQPVIQGSDSQPSEGGLCDSKVTNMEVDKPLNGPLSDPISNGPLEGNRGGAISLLHPPGPSSQSSMNGELGESSKSKSETVLIKSRSKSVDGSPANIVRVNWASMDKQTTSGASTSTTPSGKNIVISAINKANNTVVTKVLGPTQGNKLLANNVAANSGSSSTSILSPRVSGQSAIKVASVQGRTNTVGSTAKVITVSTPTTGKSGASSNSNITISGGKPSSTTGSQNSSNAIVSLNNSLQQCLEGTGDIELSKLDEKLIQILAWQRLQQLLPSKSSSPQTPNKKGVLNGLLNQAGSTEVKARAVLCPLTSKGQPISMCYRTLNIGTGADMDVCLTQFGHCNYISPKHAYVFYDETTKHYELLNYSEHGTTVDNVLYSCDFSDKPSSTPQPTSVVAAVRKIIKNKKVEKAKDDEAKEEKRLTMSGKANENKKPCNCKASSSSLIGGSGAGWEGTALLHHGSYIKVGCLQFVFSIVDHATNSLGQERKKEPMSLLKSTLRGSVP